MVEKNEKVSIIVPIYNAEKYLEECIDSIRNQTYSNIQIILINDGSTDNSWKICQKLERIDNRIIAITQANGGVSVARNKGLELADGKWIMFVDPDDILSLNIVDTLLCNVSDKIDIIACSCYGFDKNIKETANFFDKTRVFSTDKTDLYLQLINPLYGQTGDIFTAIGVPWGKLYSKSFIKAYHLQFDSSLRRMQDNIFNMYAFYYSKSILYINKPLYYYRLDHINNYNENTIKQYKKIFLPVMKARYIGLKKLGLYNEKIIFNSYINEASNFLIKIINNQIIKKNSLKHAKVEINTLKSLDCFKMTVKLKNISKIKNKSVRFKMIAIKYCLYPILYKLWSKIKK